MSSSRLSRRASLRNATAAFDAADALNSIKKTAKRRGRPPKAKADPAPRANKKVVTAEAKAVVVAHIKANESLDTPRGAADVADGDPQAQYGEIGYQWWLEPGSTTEEEDEEEEERPRAPDLEECLQDPMWCTEPCHNGCTNGEIFRAFKRAYIKYGATWPPDFERKRTRVRSRKAIAGLEAEWREREKTEQAKRPRKAKNVTAQDSVASFVSYDSYMSPSVPGSTCSDQEPSSDAEEFLKEHLDAAGRRPARFDFEEDDAWDAEEEAPQAGPSRPRWQRMQEDEDEGDMSGTLCDEDVIMGEAEDEDETMGDDESESDTYDSDYEDTDYKGKGKQRAEPVHHLRNHKGKGKARL
ncbi:uncharacterized protein SCHCODRAFT_02601874 [Schizophyllum commune H4-8]|uniref:Uncharacterized protein n=1 Tax=Schizophyllum commune (strain H4-8 / FGSC 9210) TaxID=578458 RepID=D8QEG9_SCHCM|nr:uncharacterized protein SCHCODRAFT_02601874 [Schizophyllum commune H4-8]KAI5888290.1 hypothetical protein SCHCODRAFT_02601874 [Schizophyllum commune H4-8]